MPSTVRKSERDRSIFAAFFHGPPAKIGMKEEELQTKRAAEGCRPDGIKSLLRTMN
jgi:hypothetical protein